jgi:cytochrome c-type biogenesis protein CcmH/NrfG
MCAVKFDIDKTATHWDMVVNTGTCRKREYGRAAAVLRKAIALDPTSPSSHATLGATHLFQRKIDLANQSSEEMARLAGSHPEVMAAKAAQFA